MADQAPVAISVKSRQIGISWTTAAWTVIRAYSGEPSFVSLHDGDRRREWMEDVRWWCETLEYYFDAPRDQWVGDPDGDYLVTRVRMSSGASITAIPAIERAVRGRQGHVVIDEAAYTEKLSNLLGAAIPAAQTWGWKIRVICTQPRPGAASWADWYDILAQAADNPDWSVHVVPMAAALRDGLYRRIASRTRTPPTQANEDRWLSRLRRSLGAFAAQELDCEPGEAAGGYIPRVLAALRQVPCPVLRDRWSETDILEPADQQHDRMVGWLATVVRPHVPDLGRRRWLGWDVARSPAGDPIVGVVIEDTPESGFRPVMMLEFRGLPEDRQRQVIEWLWSAFRLHGCAIDATGVGYSLGQWAEARWPSRAHGVPISRPWYAETLPAYREALEAGTQDIPRDPDVLTDHSCVVVENGLPKIAKDPTIGTDGLQRHGDAVVALLMARHAAVLVPSASKPKFTPVRVNAWGRKAAGSFAPGARRGMGL